MQREANLLVMRDVAIAKSEFVPGQKAVTKIQNFENDEVLFDYCKLPEVSFISFCTQNFKTFFCWYYFFKN